MSLVTELSLSAESEHLIEVAQVDDLPAVHEHILRPSFPAKELMKLDRLVNEVEHGDTEVRIIRTDDGTLAGTVIGTWYEDARVLLLDYLALRPGQRGGGMGAALLNESVASWAEQYDPCIVLAEVEHPDHHNPHPQHGDPEARLRFYARQGARFLPLPYFTPGVGEGMPRVGGMILTVLHAHESMLDDDTEEIASEPIARVLHLQGVDREDHDNARADLIATTVEEPTLPLLRADRVADVPIGAPDDVE